MMKNFCVFFGALVTRVFFISRYNRINFISYAACMKIPSFVLWMLSVIIHHFPFQMAIVISG